MVRYEDGQNRNGGGWIRLLALALQSPLQSRVRRRDRGPSPKLCNLESADKSNLPDMELLGMQSYF